MPVPYRVFITAALTAVVLYGCSGGDKKAAVAFPDSLVDDEEVVLVNSKPITGRDLRVFTLIYQPAADDSLQSRIFNLQLLNGYIDRLLLWQEATASGITVDDSTTKWFVDRFVNQMGGGNAVYGFLSRRGVMPEELQSTIQRDLVVRRFIEGPLAQGIEVTEEEARQFYDANADRFEAQDSVRARHIILLGDTSDTDADREAKRARLGELARRARAGEDFAELARKNSEGPSAPQGGDLGYFAKRDMVAPFANAAFAMKPGDVSDVVETSFGYHIIKVEGRKPAKEIGFEDVKDQIVSALQQRQLSTELEIHLKRNRAVAIIEPAFDYGGLTQRESATFTR